MYLHSEIFKMVIAHLWLKKSGLTRILESSGIIKRVFDLMEQFKDRREFT